VNTATIGAAVTVASLLVGGFLAWELRWARSRAYRALLWAMLLLPLWTSVVVRNYAFTVLLQRNGVVNAVLRAGRVTHEPLALLYTKLAVFLAMTHSLIPYAALPLYGVFMLIDRDLVHAARSLGASPLRAFTSVVVPIAMPAIVGVGALVFVVASGYYVAPVLLGSPRNAFFATIVDQQVNDLYDVPGAAAAAFLLLACGTLVLLTTVAVIGRRRLASLLR
jgi:ABC-type spermidine/putrescine transport system permease subunit I